MVSNDSKRRKPLERKELYRGSVKKSDSNPNLEKQSVRPENVKLDEEDTGNGLSLSAPHSSPAMSKLPAPHNLPVICLNL
jgi:hypothetical protein